MESKNEYERIEESISSMDRQYDANFGEWIRNEQNCKVIGQNIRSYIDKYRESQLVTVIKWIVKNWALKSIILFSRKLITEDTARLFVSPNQKERNKRFKILSGLIYPWSPLFITEFLIATSLDFSEDQRAEYFFRVLSPYESEKVAETMSGLAKHVPATVTKKLLKLFASNSLYDKTSDGRTESFIKAMNLK